MTGSSLYMCSVWHLNNVVKDPHPARIEKSTRSRPLSLTHQKIIFFLVFLPYIHINLADLYLMQLLKYCVVLGDFFCQGISKGNLIFIPNFPFGKSPLG
jgi:hypothetical protein